MTVTVRADGMGCDVEVPTEYGVTHRAVIKLDNGHFRVVNGWKLDDGYRDYSTRDWAIYAARNLEV